MLELDDCIQRTPSPAHRHALKHQTTAFRELVPLLICTHSNTRRLHSENSFPYLYARTQTPDDCIQRTRPLAHMHALKHQTTAFRELGPLLICTHSHPPRLNVTIPRVVLRSLNQFYPLYTRSTFMLIHPHFHTDRSCSGCVYQGFCTPVYDFTSILLTKGKY